MSSSSIRMAAGDRPPAHTTRVRAAWSGARRRPWSTLAILFLIGLCLAAVLAPWVAPYDPIRISLSVKLRAPSALHWLGTDHFGRDVLSRILYGGRVSLSVGAMVTVFTCMTGVPVGLAAGYYGGWTDTALMRLTDAMLAFPPLLLASAIVGLFGADVFHVMLAIGLVQAPVLARMVRGSALAAREEVHVRAARALGAGPLRVVLSNVLRNIMGPIIVQLATVFATAVVTEAALSFLGLGTQPPLPSWGRDLSDARRFLADAPWMFFAPSAAIVLAALGLKSLGDAFGDWCDPRTRHR